MRIRMAAALTAVVVMVGLLGAPVMPVMLGATAAYVWLLGRSFASR